MSKDTSVCICVDAMGGDDAPSVVLEGVELALNQDPDLRVLLVGPEDIVAPFCESHDRCEAQFATEVIEMGEHPATAVRKKRDSSIVVGCKAVKEGRADGFFSAGSTGACMSAATLFIGRASGVLRPAIATIVPAPAGQVILTDCGANADCKPEYLLQFAQMATIYARNVSKIENPTVALLNIGEEETKGNELTQACHQLLKEKLPEFVGNAEGNDIIAGKFDIIVTDGYTGNVAMKTVEGTAKELFRAMKNIFMANLPNKIASLILKESLMNLKGTLSADVVGGSPLLGLKAACVIGHGNSSSMAICNGIHATSRAVRANVSKLIGDEMTKTASAE